MITITYSLTPKDLEEVRIRSLAHRVVRMCASVCVGLLGLGFAYAEISLFRGWALFWKHGVANVFGWTLALFLLWVATDLIGLQWFLQRYTSVFASHDVCFTGDIITVDSGGKMRTLRWLRDRGFTETPHLFLLPIHDSDSRCLVPKRALEPGQERAFRDLLNAPQGDTRFVVDFFLTEADVVEVSSATRTWLSTKPALFFVVRVFCGAVAVFFLLAPGLGLFSDVHGGWPGMWRSDPLSTLFMATYCVLGLGVAAGQARLVALTRYLNHYDQRRIYTFTNGYLNLTRGEKTRHHSWKYIWNFRETPGAFVLRTQFVIHYIIPKSALGADGVEAFRSFLLTKLVPAAEKLPATERLLRTGN